MEQLISIQIMSSGSFFTHEFRRMNGKVIEKESSRRAGGGNEGGRKIFLVCNFLYRDYLPFSSTNVDFMGSKRYFPWFPSKQSFSLTIDFFLIHWSSFLSNVPGDWSLTWLTLSFSCSTIACNSIYESDIMTPSKLFDL